ncbi:P-loop containing nucleoside triphosphate hydrolase protein [Lentinula raphanica]|nr:P-loop containing nucleoside triphosphate hydrolase protein [Lentinula raphanica]
MPSWLPQTPTDFQRLQTKSHSLLIAIILLGNLKFGEVDFHTVSAHIPNSEVLDHVSHLLGISSEDLSQALTNKTSYVRKKLYTALLSAKQSASQRDQLVLDLYAILFAFVVETAYHKLAPSSKTPPPYSQTVMLDQPGHQSLGPEGTTPLISAYGQNGFDEFCINFADKMLQSYYTHHTFEDSVGYNSHILDNTACVEMPRGQLPDKAQRKPGGLLPLMNKASSAYKQDKGSYHREEDLLQEMQTKFGVHEPFVASSAASGAANRTQFGVNHYAGNCTYDVTDFVEQDTDLLDFAFVTLSRSSSESFVAKLFFGPSLAAEKALPGRVNCRPSSASGRSVEYVVDYDLVQFWFIPSFLLTHARRMKRPDVRLAWREKVTICLLIFLLNGIVIFGRLLYPDFDNAWLTNEVAEHTADNPYFFAIQKVSFVGRVRAVNFMIQIGILRGITSGLSFTAGMKFNLPPGVKILKRSGVHNSKLYDLTDYFYTQDQNQNNDAYIRIPPIETVFKDRPGQDITDALNTALGNLNETYRQQNPNCLNNVFYVGETDYRTTARCQAPNITLITGRIRCYQLHIIGICGETKVANEDTSWWTMIQVYEYYISHPLTKAFEISIVSERLTKVVPSSYPITKFDADAVPPESTRVLFSQRRRWIDSMVHMCELVMLPELIGFSCFSMRIFFFVDLLSTIILPSTVVYLVYLEETMIVSRSCLPDWALDLPQHFPFIVAFATKYHFLQSTSFPPLGMPVSSPSGNHSKPVEAKTAPGDGIRFLGRLQRQKLHISRKHILESAVKVFELYGSSSLVLEVVGMGLGLTLELYALVSKELARKDLKIWRDSNNDAPEADASPFVHHPTGLYLAPIGAEDIANDGGQKSTPMFRVVGQFVAKTLSDSRIIALSFNNVFLKLVLEL